MARFISKKKHEIGLSPDAFFFRGEQKAEEVLLRVIDFDSSNLEEKQIHKIDEIKEYKDKESVTWLNIDGLHKIDVIAELGNIFDFDSMMMADVLNTQARPKIHEYDKCLYASIKMLQLDEETGKVSLENLSLVMNDSILISFQEKRGDVFEPVRERIRNQKKRIRSSGTDYLLFALLDIVIDNYIYVLSVLGEKTEVLEENLLNNPPASILDEINTYKKELNFIRRNIKPAKEMLSALSKVDSRFIEFSTDVHWKELIDNISQANDSSESYREILSDQLNIYHTTISSKLNDVMKFLTIFSVIFIPLTFIAGIYGTNFEYVPELTYRYSYFIMWGVMIVTAIGMLFYFRHRKWV
jgi:magnesium transporter